MAKKLKLAKGNKKAAAKVVDKPEAKKAAKKAGTRKFAGKTTGLSVTAFQNKLMAANFKAKLTDEKLAAAMRAEFPSATAYTVQHVVGIRSAWNNGKHGNEMPEKKLPRFNEDGTSTLETRGRGGKKAAAKKDKAAPKPAPVKKVGKKAAAPEPEPEEPEDDEEEEDEEDGEEPEADEDEEDDEDDE